MGIMENANVLTGHCERMRSEFYWVVQTGKRNLKPSRYFKAAEDMCVYYVRVTVHRNKFLYNNTN